MSDYTARFESATAKMPARWDKEANGGSGGAVSEPTEYQFPVFDTLQDALSYNDGSEEAVLKSLNAHIKETIKNNAYSAALNKVQPADMSKVREGLVRNMVKAGLPISVAESKVDEIMSTLQIEKDREQALTPTLYLPAIYPRNFSTSEPPK